MVPDIRDAQLIPLLQLQEQIRWFDNKELVSIARVFQGPLYMITHHNPRSALYREVLHHPPRMCSWDMDSDALYAHFRVGI